MSIPPFDTTARTTYTQSPNPTWTYGQRVDTTPAGKVWIAGESQGWKVYNTAETDKDDLNMLMISGIAPRPIALVSTIDEQGVENISPFSWFNMVANYPPVISFAYNHRSQGRLPDTATNMMNNQGFAVNILSEPFVQNANVTSIDAPPDFDEWSISGLTKEKCVHVKASRVKESAFSMECELYKTIDITHPVTGEQSSTLILAHVRYIHVRRDMLTERGTVDLAKLKPVARLDDISYGRVGDAFMIARPSWAQEEAMIQGVLKTLASH